ncbi:MAG: AraC family transcriptional regulator [Gorillibacterium sp.]|nr:AraC family transcriptional regulator [Gorillibacterium sp.]
MSMFEFTLPPLLHFIASNRSEFAYGERHFNRCHTQVFDLLVVQEGCIYIGEEERRFEVSAGQALILRPDCNHFGTLRCNEPTVYYWVHFQTSGAWCVVEDRLVRSMNQPEPINLSMLHTQFDTRTFALRLPQYINLLQPAKMEDTLNQIIQLTPTAHLSAIQFKQQILFQDVVQQLVASREADRSSLATLCAEQAAAYLRSHYQHEITAKALGESLSFHPVYIARCMQREYGYSPTEYLLHYRIEQSKLLLMQTSYSIARIAEEVGFNQAPYFSSSFLRVEGISPRKYRQRFTQQ